ncbi:MAG: nucleoside transporter C-terminal domain-containing protein [Myxococcota bacterium]
MGLQFVFAVVILWFPPGRIFFEGAKEVVETVLGYGDAGANLVFGVLGPSDPRGPVTYTDGLTGDLKQLGVIFAFHILPTIIFFGAFMSVLYHLGVVQFVVRRVASFMRRAMGTSGSESLSAAGNIFVGQTEAPLLVKPYVAGMTPSELMAIMCGGFATVAGGVLAAYVRFGVDAGHLLAASVMSAPAALVVAKIMYPETEKSQTGGGAIQTIERTTSNVIDAAATGASDGMKMAINVGAMLIAFTALIALLNGTLGWFGGLFDISLSLNLIFGALFYPISWLMGVDTQDLLNFGNLLGTKIAINEFVAYVELGSLRSVVTERTYTIATYALCGFANFSSIGIQIGGISAIAPERRTDLAKLGLKAMIGGAIASWLTACIAGVLL